MIKINSNLKKISSIKEIQTMSYENTQLTQATGYNPEKSMIFGKPKEGSIPNSTVVFKRVPIGTRNPDGTTGELVIPTERVYSFGPSANVGLSGQPDGYSLSLCLHHRDGPTQREKEWVETFNHIVENIKTYLITNRDLVGKYELEMTDLKKLNPLYYKREKGKVVEGSGPVLYPKLLQKKKGTDVITTPFCNEKGEDIDPMTILNKACYVTAAVKIESIFIGAKISLQVKVYEAEVKMIDNSVKRLLRKPASSSEVVMDSPAEEHKEAQASKAEDDNDSVKASDDESDEEPVAAVAAPVAAKAAPRRTIVRKQ